MSVAEHKAQSPKTARCFVLTISDTRTMENDVSGRTIAELLADHGHVVTGREILPDDADQVQEQIQRRLSDGDVEVIITTGGTGITSRDSTYEAINALLEKRLDGFGELFRMLSYQEIGSAAMASRACAGTAHGRIIFSLPGSEAAVRLALTKLILPELGHLVREVTR